MLGLDVLALLTGVTGPRLLPKYRLVFFLRGYF